MTGITTDDYGGPGITGMTRDDSDDSDDWNDSG